MRSEFSRAVIRLLWGQWTALGVSGTVPIPDHVIDLARREALLGLIGQPLAGAAPTGGSGSE